MLTTGRFQRIELLAQGVEVVKADLDDVESVKKAVKGSYGVFGVTNCAFSSNFIVPSSICLLHLSMHHVK